MSDPDFGADHLLEHGGTLTVRGTTASLLAYAVEITDPQRAAKWDAMLSGCKYRRCAMGVQPKRRKVC
jgi:hypothetical protein